MPGRAEQLLKLMAAKAPAPIWRVGLRYAGEDPRVALRNDGDLSAEERVALVARLDRFDRASSYGPWTRATLALIEGNPAKASAGPAATRTRTPRVTSLTIDR